MKTTRRNALAATLALAVAALCGCDTPVVDGVPVDDALAAVSVHGADARQLRDAIYSTMATAGFERSSAAGGLAFDKRGSAWKQIQYGSYMGGASYDRIKLNVESLSETSHVIRANVYNVTSKGSMAGDDERPVLGLGASKYQSLLNQIKARAEAGG